ncbi:MAG: GNAT family protein [Candidatus Margulisiibacteriota bacterium]
MMKGRLVDIRFAKENDIEDIIPWTLDEELCRLLYGSLLRSKNEQAVFLRDLIGQNNKTFPPSLFFIIESRSGLPIGFINLHSIDWRNRNLMNDMAIADKGYRGRGAAIEVISLAMKMIFKELNMNKLSGNIYDFNEVSLSLYKKCSVFGVVQEGTLRKHVFKFGRYHDAHIFSILKEDYDKNCRVLDKFAATGEK